MRYMQASALDWDRYCDEKYFLALDSCDGRIEPWQRHLAPYRDHIYEVWEVGSFEGQSACFWLEFFPRANVTCIDHWLGSREHFEPSCIEGWAPVIQGLEARFDHNVSPYGKRVTKVKAPSAVGLGWLAHDKRRCDLVYIDGDHAPNPVLVDSLLAWPCLNPGGIIIWDDVHIAWPDHLRPTLAVEAFRQLYEPELELIADTEHQLIMRKTEPRVERPD